MKQKNEGFNKDWDEKEFVKQLFKDDKEIINDNVIINMVGKLIQELCKHEKKEIVDIEYAGDEFYNFNLKIGSFILKLGDSRETRNIPKDKRIIKPLIRQEVEIKNSTESNKLFIEIQNAVDSEWYKNLSEEEVVEELYKIYSELRDSGKKWTDVKPENVGRLLKTNKENFKLDGEELKSSNYAIGFFCDESDEKLEKGELVVIDTDYIYEEGEKAKIPKKSYYKELKKKI